MSNSNGRRLSVSLVDVAAGHEAEFLALSTRFEALIIRKNYGHAEMIRDEARPLRFYAVRNWIDASAAERCHADPEVQALTAQLYQIASVTNVVNGVRRHEPKGLLVDGRRTHVEADRRTGFDRRQDDSGRATGNRRGMRDRR